METVKLMKSSEPVLPSAPNGNRKYAYVVLNEPTLEMMMIVILLANSAVHSICLLEPVQPAILDSRLKEMNA